MEFLRKSLLQKAHWTGNKRIDGENMKIMQIIPAFEVGGGETMCENLTYELIKLGHNVLVVSLYTKETLLTRRMKRNGVNLVFLDKKLGIDLPCVFRLRKVVREFGPDVIHTHLYALKYASLAKAFLHIKGVHTVHNVAAKEASRSDQKINYLIYHFKSAVPVSLSEDVQKTVLKLYSLRESPIIYNGIDLSRCQRKTDYSLNEPIRLIHVGRFTEQKNHTCIIDALQLLPRKAYHIDFFGEGELLQDIKEKVQQEELMSEVSFRGTTDNIYDELTRSDIFLLPSKWEGMPMSIIEAMGTGLPIIVSNVGGISNMVSDRESAILINPNSDELYRAIKHVSDSFEIREKIGQKAVKRSYYFSSTNMAHDYIDLYQGNNDLIQ